MNDQRPTWDDYFVDIARAVAQRADCTRRQVGAVIVKDNRIVSTGYNGGPSGGPSCLAGECPRGRFSVEEVPSADQGNSNYSDGNNACIAIHAEVNALLYADRSHVEGGTMYITCAPCEGCWKVISGSGLQWIRYPNESGGITQYTASGPVYVEDRQGEG